MQWALHLRLSRWAIRRPWVALALWVAVVAGCAILVDATLVRLVLLPATITLLGPRAFWWPRLRGRPARA